MVALLAILAGVRARRFTGDFSKEVRDLYASLRMCRYSMIFNQRMLDAAPREQSQIRFHYVLTVQAMLQTYKEIARELRHRHGVPA